MTVQLAELAAGDIVRRCNENEWKAISVDCEWDVGSNTGAHTVQIGLPDGMTFLFQLSQYDRFPRQLKLLLECKTLIKVGHAVCNEKRKLLEHHGVELGKSLDTGHMAKDRGLVDRRNCSLAELVKILFKCELEKDLDMRLSAWDKKLSKNQKQYAALDAYATISVYMKLLTIPFVDATTTPTPQIGDVVVGTRVLLYTKNKATVVARGTVAEGSPGTPHELTANQGTVTVKVQQEDVLKPAALVSRSRTVTFSKLFNPAAGDDSGPAAGDDSGFREIPWSMTTLRLVPAEPTVLDEVTVTMETRSVARDEDFDDDDIAASAEEARTATMAAETDVLDADNEEEEEEATGEDETDACNADAETDACNAAAEADACNADEAAILEELDADIANWHQFVKNDIVHIFLRFARVVSKDHGAFGAFMARLSDAFFIPSQSDIAFIKKALRNAGMSEDDIKKKPWSYYKRRVRRLVPSPKILEREFKRVCAMFADVPDAKTGKKLFGPRAKSVYKSTLKHIRKGCLSDVDGMAYYVQVGEDSFGIPLYKCIRGTSALEGFHQKIRQLIRGFNISPRYAIAILTEFIYRWNHSIDVRLLGLSEDYQDYYDGWEIEHEIEVVGCWEELDEMPHPNWDSTRDYGDTGEVSGLPKDSVPVDWEVVADKIDAAGDDGILDSSDGDVDIASFQVLPESKAWVSNEVKAARSVSRVQTASEKIFFSDNYMKFHGGSGDPTETGNFHWIRYAAFAQMWNERIVQEEAGNLEKTDWTLKTAYHLQKYHVQFKQRVNASLTCVDVPNGELRRELRGPDRVSIDIPAAASIPKRTPRVAGEPMRVQTFMGRGVPDGFDGSQYKPTEPALSLPESSRKEVKIPTKSPRCRRCGQQFGPATTFGPQHANRGKIGTKQKLPHEVCTVEQQYFVEDYPLKEGQKHPRPSRAKVAL